MRVYDKFWEMEPTEAQRVVKSFGSRPVTALSIFLWTIQINS